MELMNGKSNDVHHPIDVELLLKQVTELVINQRLLSGKALPEDKINNYLKPEDIKNSLDLSLDGDSADHLQLLQFCKQAVELSVHTNHPKFLNQLYHGADPVGLAGAWLSEALNTNVYTFEVAPFFTMVEQAVLEHLRGLVGWEAGDGIFAPGGSISNMYGAVLARFYKFPDIKTKGVGSTGNLVAFTSKESHYSFIKIAHWIGLGTDNLIFVDCDEIGRMIPGDLEGKILKALEQNKVPFFVNATSGTTVLGAYDPLEEVALICHKYEIWLHVDAAWGGGVLVSRKHRSLMNGIERADSVAWNLHKMLGAPLQCATFLTKHQNILHQCNSSSATYLFQVDKYYNSRYDTGDKSVQCGRKVDAFKLWLMWKAHGNRGLEILVENAFDCSRYLSNRLSANASFKLVLPQPNCTNVCFWFIPPRLQKEQESPSWWDEISKVTSEIKKRMVEKGSLMIGYQPLSNKQLVNFFRVVVPCQPPPVHEDMDFIIEEIERLGADL